MERIALDKIRMDGGTQPRAHIIDELFVAYADDMQRGDEFPPVQVVYDGSDYWLWDGYHRVHAARKAGCKDIAAEVVSGTLDDAQWLACSANRNHGLRRTNADKERAVKLALKVKSNETDHRIANHVGVSHSTVAKYRIDMASTGQIGQSDTRTGRDGRTINTAGIRTSNAARATARVVERRDEVVDGDTGEVIKNPVRRTMTLREYEAMADTPSVALARAGEAIDILRSISRDDPQRHDALMRVIDWIKSQ